MKHGNRPLTTPDGEVHDDLTDEELSRFRPSHVVLPPDLYTGLLAMNEAKRGGRPKAEMTKERITIRLSSDVLAVFRAQGRGWQTRMDEVLREWVKAHS